MNRMIVMVMLATCGLGQSARAGGTHFLVEPYTGLMFNQGYQQEDAVAFESGVLAAVGGKFKGFPPRFYAFFDVGHAEFGQDDVFASDRLVNARVRRSYTRLLGGLRTVIPLFGHLRLNLDIGAGTLFSVNRYAENGRSVDYDERLSVMELGLGFNLRLLRWLSVGLMYDFSFLLEEESGDMISAMLGQDNHGANPSWSHLSATLGFHF